MPIKVPDQLPAKEVLSNENIFVMDESVAYKQDIRPLRIAILNLMPTKLTTETQLIRLIANTPLQIEIVLVYPRTHVSKNTPTEHLEAFYKTFEDIEDSFFDGFIITGAPVEHLAFEDVTYWEELQRIMDWSKRHVTSTLHICWAAQAGLYHHFDVPKHELDKKIFGVFDHTVEDRNFKLFRGFDQQFKVPHSRYTEVRREDIEKVEQLEVLSASPEAGVCIAGTRDGRQIFITGHAEYDAQTLKLEYDRDVAKGTPIDVPSNYYPNDDPSQEPLLSWRAHGSLLFSNWLNYYVYQETPYDFGAGI